MTLINETELERFFERDIIEFLDQRKEQNQETPEKKLERLIINKNYEEAIKIIQETIKSFNSTPLNNPYREIYFNKTINLVRLAHNQTQNSPPNELTELINVLINSGQLKQDHSQNITILEEIQERRIKQKEQLLQRDREKAKQIENQMIQITKELSVQMRKRDVPNAMRKYQELKKQFEQYPNTLEEEKTEIYNEMIAFYMRITKLKEELITQQKQPKTQEPTKKIQTNKLKIQQIKEIILEIQELQKQEKFKEAKNKTLEFKHKISLIPENYINIKSKLEQIANTIIQKIEFNKQLHQEIINQDQKRGEI